MKVLSRERFQTAPAVLALADGTVFRGRGFGHLAPTDKPSVGEVVFNTSMFGYQEILTDPSYAGQTIVFTYPHIGNVGCNDEDNESDRVHATGMIVRSLSPIVSNFRATKSLPRYLEDAGVMGISDLDTRAIVAHVREKGAQMGAMAAGENINPDDLISAARAAGSMEGKDYVKAVSTKAAYHWTESAWSLERLTKDKTGYAVLPEESLAQRPHVVAVDCGVKRYILRLLTEVGFRVTVVPATTTAQEIFALRPEGVFLSNGPGDPATLNYVVKTAEELVGKTPIFGICLGHQILGQVFGAETYKLKFGHRGGNHPVMDTRSKKVEITVQNHGFAVDKSKLRKDVLVSQINLNDQTVEGLDAPDARVFSIQYHPEASPGPHDARHHFQRFFEMVVNPAGTPKTAVNS